MNKLFIILSLLSASSSVHCEKECKWVGTNTFEAKYNATFLLGAVIKNPNGLVIDINYEEINNDRIYLSSEESLIYELNQNEYTKTELNSHLNEGIQEMRISTVNNTLIVRCTSSEMEPVSFSPKSRITSITVSAESLEICKESCSIEKSIEKNISIEDTFKITAYITSEHQITFKISDFKEDGAIWTFEIKPNDCGYSWNNISMRIPCKHINPGWNKLNIFVNKTILLINNYIDIPIDVNLKQINITGSHIVTCKKGNPVWKISKEKIWVPITFATEIVLILSSTVVFSPVFIIAGIEIPFSWYDGLKSGSYGKPLQPRRYLIKFEATLDMLILYNEQTTDVLFELNIFKVPDFILVRSLEGEFELTIFVKDLLNIPMESMVIETIIVKSQSSANGTTPMIKTPTSSPMIATLITCLVLSPLVIIAVWIYFWKRKKDKQYKMVPKMEEGKNERINDIDPNIEAVKNPKHEIEGESFAHVHKSRIASSSENNDIRVNTEEPQHFNRFDAKEHVNNSNSPTKETIIDARLNLYGKDKPVLQLTEELGKLIESIFQALNNNNLYGKSSADSLLRDNGLPGTIRDSMGNSILHYLVFPIQQENKISGMNPDKIKMFIESHKLFVNATNYKGETPLHALTLQASKAYSTEEWKNQAQFLIDVGCDPRIRDNNGKFPEDIALDRECTYLQDLLKTSRENKGEMELKIDQWKTLIKGVRKNDIESVKQLLLDNVPILPLSSTTDPLREAIRRGFIELTMMLLSAGAPLCGRFLIGLNSLEVSHSTPGLSVFLAALIRREFYNCLQSESKMLNKKDSDLEQLEQAVIDLAEKVRRSGYKEANWNFSSENKGISERSKEARKMLRLAASNGMALTCQMLGLEKVFLNPLPLEMSPDSSARPNTLVVLCRDLELSLSLKEGNIPSHVMKEYEQYSFKKLRDFCNRNGIRFTSLSDMQNGSDMQKVLKYIAELGLDITYKKIFRARNVQLVDLIVDPITGFTMLHSAAYNGRMGMVEYLLLNNANEWIKTKKGFTAAHVAALRGHKECIEYIYEFSKLNRSMTNDKTISGLTAQQISKGYESEVNNLAIFLLHENIGHSILSEPELTNKARLILVAKKSIIEACLKKGSLDQIIPSGYINEHINIWRELKVESEHFIQKLIDTDSRFKGNIISHHKSEDALELLLMDSYQIYLEIENNEYWRKNNNLHKAFFESGYKTLQNYESKSANLCIVPKVFKRTILGANIVYSYCSQQITTHINIHVIPVLKEKLDINTRYLQLSQVCNDTIVQTSTMHIANVKSGKWSYVTVDIEKQLFSKVDSSKLIVLSICRFIRKVLNPHWWFPRMESRRHARHWHHYADISFHSVSERLLISLFLCEVFKIPEEKWESSNILDRVISIFRQMAKQDKNGKMVATCFLDPRKEEIKVSQNIPVIIDFLQEMRKK